MAMDIVREQEKLDEELSLDIASRMQSTCYRLCTENVYRPNLKNPALSGSVSENLHSTSKLGSGEKDCLDNCAKKYLDSQRAALEYVNKVTQENMMKSSEQISEATEVKQRKKFLGIF